MKDWAKRTSASLWYWRIAVLRCVIYGTYVMWGMFKAGTEGFEQWSDMTPMQHYKLMGDMLFVGMGGVILALLDDTIQKLYSDKSQRADEPDKTEPPAKT